MSNPGGIRKFLTKLNSNANIEQTKMTPDFLQAVERYDNYKGLIDEMEEKLESAVQQNPMILVDAIDCPPNEHPMEKLAGSLAIFQTYLPADHAALMLKIAEEAKKLAVVQRDAQVRARRAIRHIRRFNCTEYKELTEERNKLNKAREYMDQIKHEVKQSKTTEQIEKKSILYEQAVGDFDQQAGKVIDLLEKLPALKQTHQKDIAEYFDILSQYNENVVKNMTQN